VFGIGFGGVPDGLWVGLVFLADGLPCQGSVAGCVIGEFPEDERRLEGLSGDSGSGWSGDGVHLHAVEPEVIGAFDQEEVVRVVTEAISITVMDGEAVFEPVFEPLFVALRVR